MSFVTNELSEDKVVEYEFVIQNFVVIRSQLTAGDFVVSPSFPQSDLPQWCITVLPRGDGTFKFKVTVELWKTQQGKKSEVFGVKLRFLNDDRSVIIKHNFTAKEIPQGHQFFYGMPADMAIPVSDSDDLIVNVQITLSQTGNDTNVLPSTFSRDISSAFEPGILSDFSLVSSDKREFPVHKIILAMRFPQLERMFKSGWEKVKRNRVEMEFSGDCVEAMLEYVYKDKVAKLSEVVCELLQLARQYEVDRLMAICVAQMVKNLDEENLCESLRTADLCGIVPLQSACRKFLKCSAAAKRIGTGETVPLPISFATYKFSENQVVPYEFVIKNFATTRLQLDRIVTSPIFPQDDHPQWRIVVYPRGYDPEKYKFSVFVGLAKLRPGKKSEVYSVQIKFLNNNRRVILKKYMAYEQEFGPQGREFNYRMSADSKDVIPVSDSGHLFVNVEITLVSQIGYDISVPPPTFSHDFSSALQSGILSDFTITSSDQREFPVHKVILAVRVPFFDRMFESDMAEVTQKRVEVDFSGDCVEALLEYVYKDKVVKLSEIAVELVQLARVYCIDRLVSICTAEMVKNLDEENLCESLKIANLCSITPLQSACEKFIADHPTMAAEAMLEGNDTN